MSQVAKSASAFVRAFLAIVVLLLEDMVVRLVGPHKLADVQGLSLDIISVDVNCPPGACLGARGFRRHGAFLQMNLASQPLPDRALPLARLRPSLRRLNSTA